ncbi:MAG: KdsC family phosphatase [Gemmatimonadota bacterium]
MRPDAPSSLRAEAALRVKVVLLDADGVLTDGGIYVADGDAEGASWELRRFAVQDGIAIHMLHHASIRVAIVSAKESPAVRERARSLGIEEVHQVDPRGKLTAVHGILERMGADWTEAAFLADDLPDIPVLKRVGLPAAVANAVPEVRAVARWQGRVPGGKGALREFVEALLRARGEWEGLVERYLAECEAAAGIVEEEADAGSAGATREGG